MATVTNINEVLDGHVGLEIECVDRLYLNAYVAKLQVPGQVPGRIAAALLGAMSSADVKWRVRYFQTQDGRRDSILSS